MAFAFQARHVIAADDPMSDDPEVERRLLQLPEGFDIQLYASEPDVINPITMNFDSTGRMWVLCLPRYPQMLAGQKPIDYITILGKPDKNGHAESSHVFVSGLTIPTGMVPGDGGVYVGEGDSLIYFKDNNGTAGERRVLLTGFGTQDMHHAINTFRWGPDGYLYFDQGLYAQSSVETPRGLRRQLLGCIWQFSPKTLDLEFSDRSVINNNTWGHVFDAYGRPLLSSGWISDINLVLPDTPLNTSNDAPFVPPVKMTRLAGERNCGLEFVSGRHLPDDWQNNLLTGGFQSQQVYRYVEEEGPDHVTVRELSPLIISHHNKFRPVDVKMGPDGAIYVSDWYNLIIQHNQVDFRDPRRDHQHGRIWRITYKGRPLVPVPDLTGPTMGLLDHLKDPEQWTRDQVRRVLVGRDHKDVAEQLSQWVAAIHDDNTATEHDLLEALWTYQTIDVVEPALLTKLLHAKDARVRAAAATVLGYWFDQVPDSIGLLNAACGDENMQVRLYAVLAAQRIPSSAAFEAALNALDHPTDEILDFELHKTALVLQPYWYPQFQSQKLTFNNDPKRVAFALVAIHAADAVPRLLDLLQSGKIPASQQTELLTAVAAMGNKQQLATALQAAAAPDRLSADDQVRVLDAIAEAAGRQNIVPDGSDAAISGLIEHEDNVGTAAIRLAGVLKLNSLQPRLTQISENPAAPSPRRRAAMMALVQIDAKQTDAYLTALAKSDKAYSIRLDAAIALSEADSPAAAPIAAQLLHEPSTDDVAPLFNALIRHKNGANDLANAMKDYPPAADAAKIGLRELRAAANPVTPLTAVLATAAKVATVNRQSSPDELKRLAALVQSHGDAARGERIFRNSTTSCMSCHAIAGAGGNVGPDLASVGTSAQTDFLIEHILQPNKHVKDGYIAYLVETTNGDAFTGIQLRETDDTLFLRNPTHEEMAIPKSTIKKRRPIGTLMPTGLADNLTDGELADLVRFLSELGKPGPFNVGHAVVERRWLVLDKAPAVQNPQEREKLLADKRLTWSRQYTNVAGELLFNEMAGKKASVVIRCMLDVTADGPVSIGINGSDGVQLWTDTTSIPVSDRITLHLPVGKHTLDFWVDMKERKKQSLRCELIDMPDSTGRAQWSGN
ncbi:MAG TPA: PVC-type heme-binding CxxCH protein [Tepidisphaeraceae bacterium]|jgi:putative heme-binding domain-containing protein|nr:PVC-type heme-binding CxxCH protein [Tepidisphaeraceae bacterium]